MRYAQPSLFADDVHPADSPVTDQRLNISTTFAGNLALPIHRWFRYTAGFSADWARAVICEEKKSGRFSVLDPFSGSGTVLLEAEAQGVPSWGIEAHPFVYRVSKAKLQWRISITDYYDYSMNILRQAVKYDGPVSRYSDLIEKCYNPEPIRRLDALRKALEADWTERPESCLTWLTLACILRECTSVNAANCTYILPNQARDRSPDPFAIFRATIKTFCDDMAARQKGVLTPSATLSQSDARTCSGIPDGWADVVITSPPYANNYDYADATRLELCFFGEIQGWSDLQEKVRKHLVRSCSQHVGGIHKQTFAMIENPELSPIADELREVCRLMSVERESHGGKKNYHTMITAYFTDMAKVWRSLRRVVRPGGRVCFVIGDSAPYGVYVPVERWMGQIAVASGFSTFGFEKTRERNGKWKNRKHRVPLHEGRLWVEG